MSFHTLSLHDALRILLVATACDEHTVAVRFEPEVGDVYRFEADVETEVVRTVDGVTTEASDAATLEIGRAHVCTPVTNAHLVCRLLLEKKNNHASQNSNLFSRNSAHQHHDRQH